jgi:RNA polymerase sigma factor for flagellar operon FliA
MVVLHQGLVRAIAWKVHRRAMSRVDLEDLVAYGQIGLLEAISRFDGAQGKKFVTFAWHRVRGAMLDGLDKMGWFDRGFYEHGGYETCGSDAEGEWTPARQQSTRRTSGHNDLHVANAPPAEQVLANREAVVFVSQLVASLPEREAGLIREIFFEGHTLTESARRVGISTAWASRLQARTLADLRLALVRAGFT